MAAIDVSSEKEFDAKISGAGDKLVIIDYSTTWCGPCKVIAPKFDELSDKYSDSIFIKVRLALQIKKWASADGIIMGWFHISCHV